MDMNRRASLSCVVVMGLSCIAGTCAPHERSSTAAWQSDMQMLRKQVHKQAQEIQQLRQQSTPATQMQQPLIGYVSGKVLEETLEGRFRMRELTRKKKQLEQKKPLRPIKRADGFWIKIKGQFHRLPFFFTFD